MPSELSCTIQAMVQSGEPFSDVLVHEGQPLRWRHPLTGISKVPDALAGQLSIAVERDQIVQFAAEVDDTWLSDSTQSALGSRTKSFDYARMRVNLYTINAQDALAMSIRLHPRSPMELSDLKHPMLLGQALTHSRGLILVTGATSAGKTTTCTALLQQINRTRACHIVTIEDPIEVLIEPDKAAISQKEIGSDVPTFEEGLKQALQQKPDVLFVGEIRGSDAAQATLFAADSGHLVLATIQTNDTAGALAKFVGFFPAEQQSHVAQQLAMSLRCICTQALLPASTEKRFVMASEVLIGTPQLSKLIEERKFREVNTYIAISKDRQVVSQLNDKLAMLVRSNQITLDAALQVSSNPDQLRELAKA